MNNSAFGIDTVIQNGFLVMEVLDGEQFPVTLNLSISDFLSYIHIGTIEDF